MLLTRSSHGDSADSDAWLKLQQNTVQGNIKDGLKSSSLGWEVGYEKIAEMCGGKGYLVRTPEELAKATEDGFKAKVPVVVNVIIEANIEGKIVSYFGAVMLRLVELPLPNIFAKFA